jgi:hypothetical protein
MSNEFQRRLNVLEKKITVASPCRHPIQLLINPTQEELAHAEEIIASCPRCSMPSVGPKITIIEYPASARLQPGAWTR